MTDRLERLARAAAALSPVHLVGSFLAAMIAGLLIGGALGGAGGDDGPLPRKGNPLGATSGTTENRDAEERALGAEEAAGQLVLQPVRLDGPLRGQDFRVARGLVGAGQAGAILLYLRDEDSTPLAPKIVAGEVEKLKRAAADADLPPPLIVAAIEGIKGVPTPSYCASPVAGARDQLKSAREPGLSDSETTSASVRLARTLRTIGADAVLATSFKDKTEGCGDGSEVRVASHVRGLQDTKVLLFARGAQGWGERSDEDLAAQEATPRYREAADAGLRLLAAARTPQVDPAWRTKGRIAVIRRRNPRTLLSTPDLAYADKDDDQADGSIGGRVGQALDAGVDLPLYSHGPSSRGGGAAVRAWYAAHPARRARSCDRMLRLKRDLFGDAVTAASCGNG